MYVVRDIENEHELDKGGAVACCLEERCCGGEMGFPLVPVMRPTCMGILW